MTDGVILVNKHGGITSFDVVARLRSLFGLKKIGHCGTLDPLARGLIVVCLSRAVRVAQFLSDCDKEYTADILLGTTTATYDRLGTVEARSDWGHVTESRIREAIAKLSGERDQVVPPFSAVKHEGRRMYQYARRHVPVPERTRRVVIYELELTGFCPPHVSLRIACSKGTYVRALAHEIGISLGCGACLAGLTRIRIGRFKLTEALTLGQIAARIKMGRIQERILDSATALRLPAVAVHDWALDRIRDGVNISHDFVASMIDEFSMGDKIAIVDKRGLLVAVVEALVGREALQESSSSGDRLFSYMRVL
jgi:tRNA pseudouridine55 synthase